MEEWEGPRFNFKVPEARKREKALRKVVGEFKQALELLRNTRRPRTVRIPLLLDLLEFWAPPLYAAYDAYVAQILSSGEKSIQCEKGCSHCCSHFVTSVEPFELLFMHAHIRKRPDYPELIFMLHERQALFSHEMMSQNRPKPDEDEALYTYYLKNVRCPLLSTQGTCGVYAHRPISCRMFYSLSHPRLCKGKGVISPSNRNFILELPDEIEVELSKMGELAANLAGLKGVPVGLFPGLVYLNQELHGEY